MCVTPMMLTAFLRHRAAILLGQQLGGGQFGRAFLDPTNRWWSDRAMQTAGTALQLIGAIVTPAGLLYAWTRASRVVEVSAES